MKSSVSFGLGKVCKWFLNLSRYPSELAYHNNADLYLDYNADRPT